uniref:Vitelline membrane outer layer protein 1 n=1 Tax=Leptobrachium leishanense TaxID=445787 RepID=A0A8C5MBH2_9ANUR
GMDGSGIALLQNNKMLLVAFSLLCLLQFEQSYAKVIMVYNGGIWGVWGPMDVCPEGTKAAGFKLKVEPRQGPGDDTALNGISLSCVDPDFQLIKEVTSTVGPWGVWSSVYWCPNGYLQAFCLRVEKSQGAGDDTAANNIMFKCTGGQIIEGNGLNFGNYGDWSDSCVYGIDGVKSRVEPSQGGIKDDTALNDAQFRCAES